MYCTSFIHFQKSIEKPTERSRFASFQLAPNMMLAPCVRRTNFIKSSFEAIYDEVCIVMYIAPRKKIF